MLLILVLLEGYFVFVQLLAKVVFRCLHRDIAWKTGCRLVRARRFEKDCSRNLLLSTFLAAHREAFPFLLQATCTFCESS